MRCESGCVTLTRKNFSKEVMGSSKPVIVNFWASWCGRCDTIAPAIDQLAAAFGGLATVAKLDVDAEPGLASSLGIRAVPSILVFKDGMIVERVVGAVSRDTLASRLEALIRAA